MTEAEKYTGVPRFDLKNTRQGNVPVELDDPVIGTTVFEMRPEAVEQFRTMMDVA